MEPIAAAPTEQLALIDPQPLILQPAASRQLSSDYLVAVVRRAGDETTKRAVRNVSAACQPELGSYCMSYVQIAQSARDIAASSGKSDVSAVVDALRNVHSCLAERVDLLSPVCVDTLIKELSTPEWTTGTPMPMVSPQPWPTGTASPSLPPPPDVYSSGNNAGQDANGRNRGKQPKIRRGHDDDSDDSREPPRPASGGVEIYVINHGNGGGGEATGDGGAIGHGHHGHHHRHRHDHDGGMHPVVCLLVLPFFCVGVFVTVKHFFAYIRQRRAAGLSLPFAVGTSSEYTPLKAPDSDSAAS